MGVFAADPRCGRALLTAHEAEEKGKHPIFFGWKCGKSRPFLSAAVVGSAARVEDPGRIVPGDCHCQATVRPAAGTRRQQGGCH